MNLMKLVLSTISMLLICVGTTVSADDRPNVILIMSDDQGVGDYGFMGNPVIRTPALDAMHTRSGFLSRFYVSPVCAPTRASLMTGRYNYRTRCVDTYLGRAMMDPDEVTLAECLRDAGYKTGIYGKWHMGDNYPMRAMDQGFQDSLVHRGGGIGQPSDPIGAEGKYTNPVLFKNGQEVGMKGYCTDIFFDAAMDFIASNVETGDPFFTYIATNAPHGPFDDVPTDLYEQYKQTDLSPLLVSPLPERRREGEFDKLARIAAMITNIDDNVARLFSKLDELGVTDNTIVIYLNDNGPNSMRYVGDMRGMKTHVDDGGIRSPLLFHWPSKVDPNATSNSLCAHIDVMPTILDACNVPPPNSRKIDGRSFLPLLTGASTDWPTRQVVFQAHRGNAPQPLNHFAIHEDSWKLVHPSGFGNEQIQGDVKLELYDLDNDPRQMRDVAAEHPEIVKRLSIAYERWFADVSSTREDNFAPPRIVIGTEYETETVLTRQDWRHAIGGAWAKNSNGNWLLHAAEAGDYEVEIILDSNEHPSGTANVTAGDLVSQVKVKASQQREHRVTISLPKGDLKLSIDLVLGEKSTGPHQVVLSKKTLSLSSIQSSAIDCPDAVPYFGNGIKIGEVSADSAIVWIRLTKRVAPNWNGKKWQGTADRNFDVGELGEKQFAPDASLAEMEGSLPGLDGMVRVNWWPEDRPNAKQQTEWLAVDPLRDFTRQIALEGLSSQQNYAIEIESRSNDGEQGQSLTGSFRTAPGRSTSEPIRFVVATCQSWKTRDKGTAGLQIYDHMLNLAPAFFVHLGDIVYYDKRSAGGDVDARTPELARFHWNRWYGCSDVLKFHTRVPSFFIKDDHDTLTDDSEPGMSVGNLTWTDGLSIFREQVPMGESTYRSRRWSKDLHFWIVEVRDFRSPQKMKDGPKKSIWGAAQKTWFKKEVLASEAPFKILFSPTPIVGPDRPKKKDNHANDNWTHEGDELRTFCAENNVIIINGDRHWQYHSIDDNTGAHEFSSGATSEAHAGGFNMESRTDEHQYLAIIGGFLSGEIVPNEFRKQLTLRHHRVDGSVAYEYTFEE